MIVNDKALTNVVRFVTKLSYTKPKLGLLIFSSIVGFGDGSGLEYIPSW